MWVVGLLLYKLTVLFPYISGSGIPEVECFVTSRLTIKNNFKQLVSKFIAGVTGIGGNSCGQGGPLVEDRILAENHNMGFIIRPASANLAETANVAPAGAMPLAISRSRAGVVEVTSAKPNAEIMYTIGKGKAQKYTQSIPLRNGVKVTAGFKDSPELTPERSVEKSETP